jgi:hypothetical protein
VRHGDIGLHGSFPFAALYQHRHVGAETIAADMVEMEMRVDQEVDLCRVAADRHQARADLFARAIVELEQSRDARADPHRRIVLAVGVHAAVEQSEALGCSIR